MKSKPSTLLLVAALLLINIALASEEQRSVAPITVEVTDITGAVVSHAEIKVSPSPTTARLETDQQGRLSFGLKPGSYDLLVAMPGFRNVTKHIEIKDTTDQTITAALRPASCPPGACVTVLAASDPSSHFDGHTWWDYIKVLADDKMEGRDTGSRGEHAAQEYAVDQLKKAGLEPAGTNGFYQPVRFVSRHIIEKDCSLTLVHDGHREPLVLGDDAFIGTRIIPAPRVKAPLIFIGYGLKIPEKNYDDLAGLDVKGKLVVIFSGSPADIPGPLAAHYQTLLERWKVLRAAGAIGMVSLINPASMDIPWSRISLNRTHPTMDLDYPEFDETAGAKLSVTVNPASAERFFAGSGHTFAEIAELGKDRKPLPHFPLAVSLEAKTKVEIQKVESANLVAKLTGSDPALKDEYVVLSAHIDHIGIGAPINGDNIYNGAMDDGSGSALLMDEAASFKKNPENLRRSILFVFVTAEEKGLLGSKYFAAHPSVPPKSLVADVNVDMFLPIIPLKVLRVLGLDDSDLGDRAREIAQSQGVGVQPDPEPLRNLFVRSDQYNFIRHGVPSIIMSVGTEPGTPEQKIFKDWLTNRYHAPSDDLNQPVDFAAAAKYEEIVRSLLINMANDDHRPQWKQDSFFRRYASGN